MNQTTCVYSKQYSSRWDRQANKWMKGAMKKNKAKEGDRKWLCKVGGAILDMVVEEDLPKKQSSNIPLIMVMSTTCIY